VDPGADGILAALEELKTPVTAGPR
jgi:hypothetical protein